MRVTSFSAATSESGTISPRRSSSGEIWHNRLRVLARSPLLRDVIVPFIATRLALLLVGYLSACYLYKTADAMHTTGKWWLYIWLRWDS
jgi:hypothetical protein